MNLPGVTPLIAAEKRVDDEPSQRDTAHVVTQRPTGGKIRLKGLDDLDGRTNAARAAYALRDAITDDAGGADTLSALKLELITTVAVQTALLNDLHARLLSGDTTVSLAELSTLTNTRNRTAAMCGGMDRMSKTLDLHAHMSSTYGEVAR